MITSSISRVCSSGINWSNFVDQLEVASPEGRPDSDLDLEGDRIVGGRAFDAAVLEEQLRTVDDGIRC